MNDQTPIRRSAALPRLAAAAVALTWALLVVGAVVRVTGSGMGCPDWPKCFGQWLPPPTFAAWIEWTHRLLAALVSPLILAMAVLAWRQRGAKAAMAGSSGAPAASAHVPAAVALALLASQIVLGAVTVKQANSPLSVVAHLMNALLLLAAIVVTWVRASRAADVEAGAKAMLASTTATAGAKPMVRTPDTGAAVGAWSPLAVRLALLAAATTLVLALAGSMVQTSGGGFACLSFPLCLGRVWPADLGWPAEVHMLHRLLAVADGFLLGALWLASRRAAAAGRAMSFVRLSILIYALQFAVGVAQVLVDLPTVLRAAHVALAGALWLAVVALATELADARRTARGAPVAADAAESMENPPWPAGQRAGI